ncbi:MAG TPA: sigma 54-interacting transcriptional regulator [Candidatus Binatia bacterium]|nr:sigma 54-interacting transcriptional regulator [Candidatus Binatia bacterium]
MKPLADLLGESPGIEAIRVKIVRLLERQKAARRLAPVLIEGETGTGKGLLARLIHRAGPRADGPFVDVNCAAIPETLLESEMFGFERGAFTDARRAKPGLLQTANRGTIFLDEVGLLSEGLQAKLLKVLEERSVRRLGSTRDEPIDVWILTATNEDLRAAIQGRRFREDLYHRLAVLTIALPPLRERAGDILLLAEHYLGRACADYGVSAKTLAADARATLLAYPWPGNVRELANLMERVALLSSESVVTPDVLGLTSPTPARPSGPASGGAASSLDDAVRDRVADVLRQTSWNISRTAALLGISRNTLRARIEKYGLRSGEAPAPVPPPPRPERRPARAAQAPPGVPSPAPPPPPAIPPPAPAPLQWERRRVTMLRAALLAPSAPEALLETNRSLELLLDKVRSFGGTIEGRGPTGIAAAFGLDPTEDAPSRAAHAAMAIVRAVTRARQDAGTGPAIKVAVHSSQILVGQDGGASELDLEGKQAALVELNTLIQRGGADSVIVSDATAPFLTRGFEFRELRGEEFPRGRAFALVGRGRTGPGHEGRASTFVGRYRELELLSSRLESAIRGRGQIVGISGEAGIGKSRLIFEFRESLAGKPVIYVEGQCRSYGSAIPYLPVLDVFKATCGITDGDAPAEVADKARTSLLEAGLDLLETAPYLLHLLDIEHDAERFASLTPEVTKARIFETLRQLVLKKSRNTPLVIVVEDLHWIDSTSEEYLASLAEILPGARLLLVCTHRGGYRPSWIEKSYATQVALQPLAPEESLRIVRSVLGVDQAADALYGLIVAKAEGNPFFVEELARTVREQVGLVTPMAVPDTIEEVLGGRIDRLAAEDRRLLEVAAVVGKDVSFSVVRDVTGIPDDALRRAFERLKGAEFLYETSPGPETEYTFKHTLTHEVAYGRLLVEPRRALHARIVETIERLYPARLADHVERLAHHAFEGAAWAKAHAYLHQAGTKAFTRCAHQEAAACFERALTALGRLPEGRERTERIVDLRFDLRNTLQPLGEFGRILECLREAETLARTLDDQRRLGEASAYLTDYFRLMGDQDRAIEYGHQALAIADSLAEFTIRLRANTYLGQTYYVLGDYRRAAGFLTRNVEFLADQLAREFFGHGQLPSVHSRTCLVWCLAELGDFQDGVRHGREGVAIAEAVDHPFTLATAYAGLGSLFIRQGNLEAAIPILERGLDLCRTWNLSLWFPRIASALGVGYALSGRVGDALPLLERAVQESAGMRLGGGHSLLLVGLGQAQSLAGRAQEALDTARRALDLARQHKERGHEAWAGRLLGEIALRSDRAAPGAEDEFQRALALATELEMRPLIAHCRFGLGACRRRAGDRSGAEEHQRAAAALYSELGMRHWSAQAETALGSLR